LIAEDRATRALGPWRSSVRAASRVRVAAGLSLV
jgi:hypothetical protein